MTTPDNLGPDLPGGVLAAEPMVEEVAVSAGAAREQVRLGLYVSAFRCVITYLIAPALGASGAFAGFLGVAGLGLALLGSVISTYGAIRLWKTRHRARFLYVAVTCLVYLASGLALYEVIFQAN